MDLKEIPHRGAPGVVFDEVITGDEPSPHVMEQVELGKKKRIPRRIIHFIDGDTMEEYSTDEEEEDPPVPSANPKELDWVRWFWFWLIFTATKSLAAADFLGEKLAWFFGITSPKYQYVIDEYHKLKEEEEEDARLEQEEEESRLSVVSTSMLEVDLTRGESHNPIGQHVPADDAIGQSLAASDTIGQSIAPAGGIGQSPAASDSIGQSITPDDGIGQASAASDSIGPSVSADDGIGQSSAADDAIGQT